MINVTNRSIVGECEAFQLTKPSSSQKSHVIKRVALTVITTLGLAITAALVASTIVPDMIIIGSVASVAGLIGLIGSLFFLCLNKKKKKTIQVSEKAPTAFETQSNYPRNIPASHQSANALRHTHDKRDQFVRSNEQKIGDLIQSISDSQTNRQPLSNEKLDEVIDLIDETKNTALALAQYEKLEQALSEKFDAKQLDEIYQNIEIIPADLKATNKVLKDEAIAHIVRKAENFYENQSILEKLKEEIDAEVLSDILNRLEIVDLYSFRIDEVTEKHIRDFAAIYDKELEIADLLEKIKLAGNRDLYLDENYIEEMFHIEEKLQDLSPERKQEKRDELRKIINVAYINRELKNRGKITTGNKNEIRILQNLGFDIDDQCAYFDKDALYVMFKNIVTEQMTEEKYKTSSLKYVKSMVNQCALRTRLKAAGVESEMQMNKFQRLYSFYNKIFNEVCAVSKECVVKLPENFPLNRDSLNLKQLEKSHANYVKSIIRECMDTSISFTRNDFNDDTCSIRGFCTYFTTIKEVAVPLINKALLKIDNPKNIEKRISFFSKWGVFLKAELIQGFDGDDECLGDGVCWGIVQRLRMNNQQKNVSLEDFIQQIHIIPKDRFYQAAHSNNVSRNFSRDMPSNILKKEKYSHEKNVIDIMCSEKDNKKSREWIKKRLLNAFHVNIDSATEQFDGWISINLAMRTGGHATLLRMDQDDPHKVWYFDPNMGLLCFEDAERTFEESLFLCTDFINDLIEMIYPDTYRLRAFGMVTKDEKNEESMID